MIILGSLLVIFGHRLILLAGVHACFALPVFVGVTIGIWAFHTGAGMLGSIATGPVAGSATFGVAQLALALAPWAWLRLLIHPSLHRARDPRRL